MFGGLFRETHNTIHCIGNTKGAKTHLMQRSAKVKAKGASISHRPGDNSHGKRRCYFVLLIPLFGCQIIKQLRCVTRFSLLTQSDGTHSESLMLLKLLPTPKGHIVQPYRGYTFFIPLSRPRRTERLTRKKHDFCTPKHPLSISTASKEL